MDHKLRKQGTVFTFTVDHLVQNIEHPLPMAIIDMHGGGRLYLQVTDFAGGEVAIGLPGDLPINPSGGLKSFGHPIGASGVRMIYECVKQLQGKCGERQVKNPQLGLAHNVGGPGAVSCVLIFGTN